MMMYKEMGLIIILLNKYVSVDKKLPQNVSINGGGKELERVTLCQQNSICPLSP